MLFNSVEYALLLLAAFAGYWLLAGHRRLRVLLLLAASYLFYASWNYKYLSLIFLSSTMDFGIGRALARVESRAGRRALLATSVTVNLGVLCVFKYFNFFADSFVALLGTFGLEASAWHLDVLLPVGISFYTFQTLSYTIDVYRRRLAPARSYPEYLLFVSFFPQLVAGPIVRASTLLPQIGRAPLLTADRGSRALFLIGRVNHILQDSYSHAHAVREPDNGWCIRKVKAYLRRAPGYDTPDIEYHGAKDDTVGHATSADSIYREGRDCHEPETRREVEECLSEEAQQGRLATRDYLALVRRAVREALEGSSSEEAVNDHFELYVAEHFQMCP